MSMTELRRAFIALSLLLAPALFGCKGDIGNLTTPGTGGGPGGPSPVDPGIIDSGPGTGGGIGTGGTSGGQTCNPGPLPGTTRLFRMTHTQYDNAVRALTGLDVRPSADFPADQNQAGFDRGIDLQVGDALGKGYRGAAESIAAAVVGNAAAFSRVVGCDPGGGDTCARTFIAGFGRRVFRRPLTEGERNDYFALFGMGPALVDGTASDFHKGVQTVVEAMLQSPNFVYRVELATQQSSGLVVLGGYELASRLSFFLVNGPPDDVLLDAAEAGQLATVEGVAAQARRLVGTEAAKETVRDFHHQWLQMDTFPNKLTKDPARYPTVTPDLGPVLAQETERFIAEITFAQGKGFQSLVTAPFTFVNNVTAPIYGVSGSFTAALQKVDLNPAQRAGLFTQIGFLATHAYSNQSSPIHRGVYILRNVLCGQLQDPPPDIPDLPPLQPTQTTRQQVHMHTAPGACMGCHHLAINPIGYGFEHYDAVGAYRTTENGATIDASGMLTGTVSGTPFNDGVSASAAIAAAPEARNCYAATWSRYAFGRAETTGDACAIKALGANLASDDYKVTDLMVDLTRTRAFMFRAPGGN